MLNCPQHGITSKILALGLVLIHYLLADARRDAISVPQKEIKMQFA